MLSVEDSKLTEDQTEGKKLLKLAGGESMVYRLQTLIDCKRFPNRYWMWRLYYILNASSCPLIFCPLELGATRIATEG